MARLLFATAIVLLPSIAFAHVGVGDTHGIAHGLLHPLTGTDHILAMVGVGIFAAHLGGRALWLVPASFVAMMAVGGALGVLGVSVPFVEIGIGLSVVVLGLLIAFEISLPLYAAMALVGLFAVFHGHAHGAEMPATASGLAYGIGFVAATAFLHVCGTGTGVAVERIVQPRLARASSLLGSAMALAGVGVLAGAL